MPGKLISLLKDGREKQTFPVVSLHVFIGSDSFCDLRIKNKNVSPQHCLITSQKDKPALIRNLSRNSPTLVNGTQIGKKDVELKDEDTITICHKQYKWRYDVYDSDGKINLSGKPRKSWPPFKNKLVAVVTPHRRDEDLPLKKRRATVAVPLDKFNTSVKKTKVLGIKTGVKGVRKSNISKKTSLSLTPNVVQLSLSHAPSSVRKSVKFAEPAYDRRLGKRGTLGRGPSTPYRTSTASGKKSSYFTPPSPRGLGFGKTPTKGILKTPSSEVKNRPSTSTTLMFNSRLSNPENSLLELPGSSGSFDMPDSSGFQTPPMDDLAQPEIIMRSSKRTSRVHALSPEGGTPKSAAKSKRVRDQESLEAERAAKKLKENPPVAIDKKKMAALLQCHRKSLTPHPAVNRKGRLVPVLSPKSPESQPPTKSPPSTPRSGKKGGRKLKKSSDATPHSKVIPKALTFGVPISFGHPTISPSPAKKKKTPFKPVNLEKRHYFGKLPVAKMLSSPSPPTRKMTRATRAARASREPVRKREVTDVLSALDLSRRWPLASDSDSYQKPTTPLADFTNVSGIKELFSTEKTVDVRELFLEGSAEKSLTRLSLGSASKTADSHLTSRRSGSSNSLNSFHMEGAEFLSTPPSVSLPSQQTSSTSRRSLSLKGVKSPQPSSPQATNQSIIHPNSNKTKSLNSRSSISSPKLSCDNDDSLSDFSLGSFNASKYSSRDSSFSLSPSPKKNFSLPSRKLTEPQSAKKSRLSLRRVALSTSTTKALTMSSQQLGTIAKIRSTRGSLERSLPLKKRSLKSIADEVKRSRSLPSEKSISPIKNAVKKSKSSDKISSLSSSARGRPLRSSSTSNDDNIYVDASSFSNTSLKVHVGSMHKSLVETSFGEKLTPTKDKLSSSASISTKDFTKNHSGNSRSALGKIGKSRKVIRGNCITPFKSTRSSSTVNINLFTLDKLPRNLPTSTPLKVKTPRLTGNNSVKNDLKTKPTRSQSSVDIDLFALDDNSNKSKHHKSLNAGKTDKRVSQSSLRKETSLSLTSISDSSNLNHSQLELKSNVSLSPIRKSLDVTKDVSGINKSNLKNVSQKRKREISMLETTENKPTRSQTSVNKLDEKSLQSPITSPLKKKLAESRLLDNLESVTKKSDRSLYISLSPSKSVVINKYESSKSRSSSVGARFQLTSPTKSARKSRHEASSLESSRVKPTRSKSSVSIDLFKLDEKPKKSVATTPKVGSFKNKSDRSLNFSLSPSKSLAINKDESLSKSRSSSVGASSPLTSPTKSARKSRHEASLLESSGVKPTRSKSSVSIDLFKLDEKPKKSVATTPKDASLNISLSPSKSLASNKDERLSKSRSSSVGASSLLTSPTKSARKSRHEASSLESSGVKPTRSKSSVSIDLFKLDEKPKKSVATTPKDGSIRNKSDRSLNISLSPSKSLAINKDESLSKSRSSSIGASSPLTSPTKSARKSRHDASSLESSGVKPTRSKSSVSIDLFKLDEKPKKSVATTPKDGSFKNKSDRSLNFSLSPSKSLAINKDESLSKSRSSSVGASSPLTSPTKSARKSRHEASSLESSGVKPTRSKSSVSFDLFKLDEKPKKSVATTPKNGSFRNKSDRSFNILLSPSMSFAIINGERLSKYRSSSVGASSPLTSPTKSARKSRREVSLLESSRVKPTRSKSSVSIDLFKLDEKPKKSVATTPKDGSFRNKSDRSLNISLSPSKSLATNKDERLSKSRSSSVGASSQVTSPNKSARKSRHEASPLESSRVKPTRSKSSVSIDLFKLDEKPKKSVATTPKDGSFRNKSDRSLNISLSPSKSFATNKDESLSRSRSSSVGASSQVTSPNKSARKSRHEASSLESSGVKPTRSKSSVSIDLFKLDEKPKKSVATTPKDGSFRNKSDRSLNISLSPSKSFATNKDESLSRSRSSSVGASSQVTSPNKSARKSRHEASSLESSGVKPTRSKSSVSIDLFKLDEKPKKSVATTPKDGSFRNKSDRSLNISLSPSKSLATNKDERLSRSRSSSVGASSQVTSPTKSARKSRHEASSLESSGVKPTRSKSSVSIDLFKLDEKPKKSVATTPKDKSDRKVHSPQKVSSSTSSYSPHTVLSNRNSTGNQHKDMQIKELKMLSKFGITNFANNATPLCDYKGRSKGTPSSNAICSLTRKDIDVSQRTPEVTTSNKTPLRALSTEVQKRGISPRVKITGEVLKRDGETVDGPSSSLKNPKRKFEDENNSGVKLNTGKETASSSSCKNVSSSVLQGSPVKGRGRPKKIKSNVVSSTNSKHTEFVVSPHKAIESDTSAKKSPLKEEMPRKLRGRTANKIALKVPSPRRNKVLSSPIIKNSPVIGRKNKRIAAPNSESVSGETLPKKEGKSTTFKENSPVPKTGRPAKKSPISSPLVTRRGKPAKSPVLSVAKEKVKVKSPVKKLTKTLISSPVPKKGRNANESPISSPVVTRRGRTAKSPAKKSAKSPALSAAKEKIKVTSPVKKLTKALISSPVSKRGRNANKSPITSPVVPRRGRPAKSPAKKLTKALISSPVSKREINANKSPITSPVVPRRGRTAKSPAKKLTKALISSPVSKRGRNANKSPISSPVVPRRGRTAKSPANKSAKSPVLSAAKDKIKVKSPVKKLTKALISSPITKRGRNANKSPISSPVVSRRGRTAKSPAKKSAKSPVLSVAKEKVKSPAKKLTKALISSPVTKRGRNANKSPISSPVVSRRGRTAKSPANKSAKSPVLSAAKDKIKVKSPVKKLTKALISSPITKRGRNANKSPISSPVASRRGRTAKSPAKKSAKSPVLSVAKEKVKSPVKKLTKALISSPVSKRVKNANKSPISSPVVSRRGRTAKSAKKSKSPVLSAAKENIKSPAKKLAKSAISSPTVTTKAGTQRKPRKSFKKEVVKSPLNKKVKQDSPVTISKSKNAPVLKVLISPVDQYGRPAKYLKSEKANSSSKQSDSKIKSKSKGETQKATLKTAMKATKGKMTSNIKKIAKLSASSIEAVSNKTTKRTTRRRKDK